MLLERGMAMQTYWGFYITISLGLIAFMGSAQRSQLLALLVLIAFVAVAYVNGDGIRPLASQRVVFHKHLKRIQASPQTLPPVAAIEDDVVSVSEPPAVWKVMTFHVVTDILVVAAIGFLGFWPARG